MTAPISADCAANASDCWRNRGLALTASGWFAIMSVFDMAAWASEPETEAPVTEHSQSKISKNSKAPTHSPTNSPAEEHAFTPANSSAGAMDAMDKGPTPAPPAPMKGMDTGPTPIAAAPMKGMDMGVPSAPGASAKKMDLGSMQGGKAPPDARDPDAYADGYAYTGMAGMEKTDQLKLGKVLVEELEYLSGNEGAGVNWTAQGNYGGDHNKLWLRTQGQKIPGESLDPTTGAEALWWHAYAPFWGAQTGLRQDFGPGAHTYLAVGIEGLAPRWFDIQATGYIGDQGRLSARLKGSYDMRFTNRVILVPSLEANVYSKSDIKRGLGPGLGNIEAGLRLRYELHRKFAPYIGYVWERSFAGSANLRRAEGNPVNERRFVAGIRAWW